VDFNQDNLFLAGAYSYSTGYDWADGFANDAGYTYAVGGHAAASPVALQLKAKQAALSAAYSFGAIKPKITYAKGWDLNSTYGSINNSGYTQYIVGVDYALSKRTTAGISYGRVNLEKNTALAQQYSSGSDLTLKTLAFTFAHNF
jgi:predicted porin